MIYSPIWFATKLFGACAAAAFMWYLLDNIGWRLNLNHDVKRDFRYEYWEDK